VICAQVWHVCGQVLAQVAWLHWVAQVWQVAGQVAQVLKQVGRQVA
jgi:hypothetical protein